MNRVETKGSVWMLDDDAGRYCRLPKQEGPRLSPPGEDWGGPDAGALQDVVWHPLQWWAVAEDVAAAATVLGSEPFARRLDVDSYPWLIISSARDDIVLAPSAAHNDRGGS